MTEDRRSDEERTVGDTETPTVVDRAAARADSSKWRASFSERYRRIDALGAGGMGEVHAHEDRDLGREVAIKRLRAELANDPDVLGRFLREARVQARLDHPAVVPLHEVGVVGDEPYFTMKRVHGVTLHSVLRALGEGNEATASKYSRQRLLSAYSRVCEAVHYAHTRGVIHRDLKPSNIMLGEFGEVYVLDWGIAKLVDESEEVRTTSSITDPITTPVPGSTRHGTRLGTPGYMSPEQRAGLLGDIDARSDVYSLGVVLFEVLTYSKFAAVIEAYGSIEAAIDGLGADIPPELTQICVRATRRERDERYQTVRGLLDDLERFMDGDRDLALRRALSKKHAEAAMASMSDEALDDPMRVRDTMQSVGRALAFDPHNADALRVMVSVLDHVPSTIPKDVVDEVERERDASVLHTARLARWFYALPIAFTLFFPWVDIQDWRAVAVQLALNLVVVAYFAYITWRGSPRTVAYPGFTLTTLYFASLSTVFGPLILVPSLLAVNTMAHVLTWFRRHSWYAYTFVVPAVLVPWLLQQVGVAPDTLSFEGGVMQVLPWSVESGNPLSELVLLGAALGMLAAAIAVASRFRRKLDEALLRAQLFSWRVRQIVPAAGGDAALDARL